MARGLDHIAHAVRDLDAAVELYRRAGFTVGPRNRHPRDWGTQNHIVQLAGTYIELLGMADTSGITPHAPGMFSFGAFNRDFLARGEGLAMMALEGRGADDAKEFRAAGIGDFAPYELKREGRRPDGTTIRLAFTLAFAADPRAPDAGFFSCQNHYPENFWNAAFQNHANTAAKVAGVVLVADNPSDHHIFLSAFCGEREMLATSAGITIGTPRGEIQAMTPATFRDHFGVEPPGISRGARLAALRFAIRDWNAGLGALRNCRGIEHMGRIVIGPDVTMGATLVFEPI